MKWYKEATLFAAIAALAGCAPAMQIPLDNTPIIETRLKDKTSKDKIKDLEQRESTDILQRITDKSQPIENKLFVKSDLEHAKFSNPVAYKGTEILQSYSKEQGFTLQDGRLNYKNKRPKDISIRLVDSNQTIYIQGKAEFKGDKIEIGVDVPYIFNPEIILEDLLINETQVPLSALDKISNHRYKIDLVKLLKQGFLKESDGQRVVDYMLKVKLNEYKKKDPSEFGDFEQLKNLPSSFSGLIKTEPNDSLDEIVKKLKKESKTPYDLARLIFEFSRNALEYHHKELYLDAELAIKEGLGDCDDYAEIMEELLKRAGVPAKMLGADIKDFGGGGGHAFVIFGLPLKNGTFTWILSEPTWASGKEDPDKYFQQTSREYLFDFGVEVDKYPFSSDGLKSFALYSSKPVKNLDLSSLVDKVKSVFDEMNQELRDKKILFSTDYKYANCKSFYLAQSESSDNGKLLVKLNSEDQIRVSYESNKGRYLDEEQDMMQIQQLKSTYQEMLDMLGFKSINGLLSYVIHRNQYSDKIEWAQIRIDPYLVERNLTQIMDILEKNKIITSEEHEKIDTLYDVTHGKNMYHVLDSTYSRS